MRHLFLSISLFLALSLCAEPFEGFGVSLCWWAKECGKWPEEQLDSLVEWLVSPQGLNYRIFRYNIGGGDDPAWTHCTPHHFGARGGKGLRAEFEGFQDEKGGAFHWERDSAQRRIMLMIRAKRPDAIFEAFSNSAPWWMTVSGCNGGADKATDDNLAPEHYEDFACYLVEVCRHYRDVYGIEFRTLDPFNEPMTNYWYRNGGQEGCHFDVSSQVAFLRVLSPILRDSGLKTVISAADETSVGQAVNTFQGYDKAGVLPLIGQYNTHTYQGRREEKKALAALCSEHGIRLWQSESGDGGHGLFGNLRMALRLIEDMQTLRPAAWLDWQYVEVNFDQWSLVRCDREWRNYVRHKNYYVRQHFSRFILPGYALSPLTGQERPDVLAMQSPTADTLVVVRVNLPLRRRNDKQQQQRPAVSVPEGYVLTALCRTSLDEDMCVLPVTGNADAEVAQMPVSMTTAVYERR